MISGTIAFKSSMTTNPASMLPKSRIQSDNGRMTISRISFYFDIFDGLLQAYVFVFLTSLFMNEEME